MKLHPLLLLAVLTLTGCATPSGTSQRVWPFPEPPAAEQPEPGVGQVLPPAAPPAGTPIPIEPQVAPPPPAPRTAEQISGQAVASLMRQARTARDQGQFEQAASHLERAQRIEPRNYFVWSMIAQVRLDQQDFEQAVAMATKSNSLARGNAYAELENWKTIAAARAAQGDSIGAVKAQSRVEDLQRQIGG